MNVLNRGITANFFRRFSSRPLTFFSNDQETLRSSVRDFARLEIQPLTAKMDKEGKMDPNLIRKLFDQGLMGMEVPQEYGGSGLGFTDTCIAVEEISRVDPAVAVLVDIHNTLLTRALIKFGTEDQKNKYLSKLANEYPGSFAISESSAGSDAFAIKTKAEKLKDGNFKISGEKMWISNSQEAGLFLVFAVTDAKKGNKGITAFLVEKSENVKIGKKEDKLGIRASSTCVVHFDGAITNQILGKEGEGAAIAIGLLNEGRIGIAAQMLGLSKGVFEIALRYVREREQFGEKIYNFQGLRFQIARARMNIEAAHLLVYNAAALKESCDRGEITSKDFIKEAAMAKLFASEVAESTASQAIDWMGGVGFTKDYTVEKFYRDAKIGSIYEGTSNIQLETIAKQLEKENSSL